MAGSKVLPAGICSNCSQQGFQSKLMAIYFKGNHRENELLEMHCNVCGYAEDGEGSIRRDG